MSLVNLALRLLRLATEALFCFEVNRFLGRALLGPIRHRARCLPEIETLLLRTVRAPLLTVCVTLPCGLTLHTLIVGAAAEAQVPTHHGGRPLVLLHGHSMAAAFFFRNLDDLLDMGYTSVYMPDLPGWGSSSRPLFSGKSAECAVDFFLRPLRSWVAALALPPFALAGHSLGAYLAHEFAAQYPRSVTRLILTSPAAVTRHANFQTAAWFAFTPQRFLTHGGLLAHLLFAIRYPATAAYNLPAVRQFTLFANSVAHRSGDAAAAKMLRFRREGRARWRAECVRPLLEQVVKLRCPVDLIAGDMDELVRVEVVRALHRALLAEGNEARLSVIQGGDHTPHICEPHQFAKALMRGMMHSSATAVSSPRQQSPVSTTISQWSFT